MTRNLVVLNRSGDTNVAWDEHVETQVDARKKFGELLEAAYFAVATAEDGEKTLIHEFDPTAKEITMFPRPMGG